MARVANERVEAEFTVPASTQVSVSSGALSAAVAVTATAGHAFMTDLVADLQSKINAAVTPYPQSAAAMAAAVGYGTWSAGWGLDIASGNDAGLFGGVTLTAVSSPTYSNTGPAHGGDKAVGFNSSLDAFSAGDNFDADATSDLVIAWVGKFTATPGAARDLFSKYNPANPRWIVYHTGSDFVFNLNDGVDNVDAGVSGLAVGEWHVGIAVLDRGAGVARIGIRTLAGVTTVGSTASTAAIGTLASTDSFLVGNAVQGAPTDFLLAGLYIGTGTSAASGMSANLSTALTNFANAVNSAFTVSLSTSTGLVTISNSFYPCSITWTSTALRDVLGFAYNFDYPQTAAQMATALGYGTWTGGSAWLCNEASGDLAPVFGSVTLADTATPTYSNLGPRGGPDKAVGFDSATDAFSGGDVFDFGSSEDLLALIVCKAPTAADADLLTKGANPGWFLRTSVANGYRFAVGDGVDQSFDNANTVFADEWVVLIVYMDRGATQHGIAIQGLRSGTQVTASNSSTAIGDTSNAGNFLLGNGGILGSASSPQVAFLAVVSGSGVASGIHTNRTTALSNFATYMKAQTGTEFPSGVWMPGRPINLDGDPLQAPTGDDKIATIAPTGRVYSQTSSTYFRHRNVRFPMVAQPLIWANSATTVGADWETFYLETQLGQNSWFEVGSRVIVYWDNAGVLTELGNGDVEAWRMPQCKKLDDLRLSTGTWTGLVDVELGDLYADQ